MFFTRESRVHNQNESRRWVARKYTCKLFPVACTRFDKIYETVGLSHTNTWCTVWHTGDFGKIKRIRFPIAAEIRSLQRACRTNEIIKKTTLSYSKQRTTKLRFSRFLVFIFIFLSK